MLSAANTLQFLYCLSLGGINLWLNTVSDVGRDKLRHVQELNWHRVWNCGMAFCPKDQGINQLHAGDGVRVGIIPNGLNLGENVLNRIGLDA